MNLLITIEMDETLKKNIENIKSNIQEDLNKAVKTISTAGLKKAEELAQQHLSNRLANMYKSSLKLEQISENMAIIELDEKMMWIEIGRKKGFMEELLKSGTKKSKDGSKYKFIPIESSKKQNIELSAGQNLVNELKNFLNNKNIRTEKNNELEKDDKGSPRIGKIHTFNIKEINDKKQFSQNISRISVFQNKNSNNGKIEKSIVAFRVISEKHKGTGKWVHPGIPASKILEQVFKYSEQIWQSEIFPAIKAKYER